MVTADLVLSRLPPYHDQWSLIKNEQYVPDIIKEITTAHRINGRYYDRFSDLFYSPDAGKVSDSLYDFCKKYIEYREESVEFQTSAIPTGILMRGYGDCKHYASFCAGVIASLNRLYRCCFEANFLFVAYRKVKEPYHVYVSVMDRVNEIWIDPTPGSGGTPHLIIEKPV
jgi:hypothetical protein